MGTLLVIGNANPRFADNLYYGIRWRKAKAGDTNITPERIGSDDLHRSLPIQSQMRRCLLKDDGTVNYYLNATDSTKKESSSVAADLTGADGQVMVEVPEFYYKLEDDGEYISYMMSPYELPSFRKSEKMYISAYQGALDESTSTKKLASVVNLTDAFRHNQAAWDGTFKDQHGKPATGDITLTLARTYAKNRGTGWYCYLYQAMKTVFWLFSVEYCNFNSQADFTGVLVDGKRQGGLGAGVSAIGDVYTKTYAYYPVVPCGVTNSLGNNTGVVNYDVPKDENGGVETVQVPSYRGIENPFGHIWMWVDGAKLYNNKWYVCTDITHLSEGITAYYTEVGTAPAAGYIKSLIWNENADILVKESGGSSSTFLCDNFWVNASGERGLLFGGLAHLGSDCGLVASATYHVPSHTYAYIGSRLVFVKP